MRTESKTSVLQNFPILFQGKHFYRTLRIVGFLTLGFSLMTLCWDSCAKDVEVLTPVSNYVWTIADDGPFLWIGSATGMSRLQKDSGEWQHYPGKNIKSILPDENTLWVGTLNGFFSFQKDIGEWKTYAAFDNLTVYAVAKTASHVWVGTLEKGVGRLEPKSGDVVFLSENEGLPSRRIYALCADETDLWIGTGRGLVRYNPEKNKIQIFQEKDGLAQNSIASLMLDGNTLWVGTLVGVSRFDKTNGQWESWSNYESLDGSRGTASLEVADTSIFSFARDENYVYMGTNDGIFAYQKNTGTWSRPIKFKNFIKTICLCDKDLYFAWSKSVWGPGNLEKRRLNQKDYVQCQLIVNSPAVVKKDGNTYIYDAKLFQCHEYMKSYRGAPSGTTYIYRDEEMSLDFSIEEKGKDILLTFHGVNGDHIVKPSPMLEIKLNGQLLARVPSTFMPENLAGIYGWVDLNVPVPMSFLKKNNHITIKNLGPDWWMISGMKITVMDTKINEVCFKNMYDSSTEKKVNLSSGEKPVKPFLVDGKPFFPFAMSSPLPETLEDMHKIGFNCAILLNASNGPFQKTERGYLDSALRHKQKVFAAFGHPAQTVSNGEQLDMSVFEEVIRNIGDHPALAGWISFDEPDGGLNYSRYYEQINSPSAMNKIRDFIQSHDKRYLPIFLNLCVSASYPELSRQYANACDVLTEDHYSLEMSQTVRWADYLMEATAGSGKPTMIWLQAYYKQHYKGTRVPTPVEMKCMSYLSIVRHMKGLLYFVYVDPKLAAMMFDDLPEEVSRLQEVISGQDAENSVKVEGDGVYALLKDGSDGQYLIAVNSTTSKQEVAFNLPTTYTGKATVIFENRELTIDNGVLKDVFHPYERHVYKFETP